MKKSAKIIGILTFCFMALFCLAACAGTPVDPPPEGWQNPTPDTGRPTYEDANVLVVYFSVPDNQDNSYVEANGEQLGNTQYMAYVIQENTNANIFRILPTTPYPTDHSALLQAAQEERRTNARPEIEGVIENFDAYDVVFVGYPNWNSDLPNILYTFFDTYDFSGKTIVPFNTHGGSGFSGTRQTIQQLEPDAEMLEGLSISRSRIDDTAAAEQESQRNGYMAAADVFNPGAADVVLPIVCPAVAGDAPPVIRLIRPERNIAAAGVVIIVIAAGVVLHYCVLNRERQHVGRCGHVVGRG